MKQLDRYVFKEVLAPTLVGFAAYTGFMLIRGLVQFSDLILQSDNPARDTAKVLSFSLPHIVVLTIPIAFLLGLLIGVGRLSSDSELIALRASGVDLLRLYRPIGALSALTFFATLALMVLVVPRTNLILYELRLRLSTFVIAQRMQPGLFSPEFAGRRIYVEGASADRRELNGLIVSDRSNPAEGERLTLARRGTLELDEAGGQLWLRLEDAVTHHVGEDPASYDRTSYDVQRILLEDANAAARDPHGVSTEKQLREQTLPELLRRSRDPRKSVVDHRLTWVEIQKKFALPAACLVFGLLGLPLGVVNRRGGRAAGFAVSVAIVLGYYILLAGGEARAIEGRTTPFLAMWLPNLLLLGFGVFALLRLRRDLPALPTFVLPRRPAGAADASVPRTRRLSARTLLIDRYVAGRFLRVFSLVVASILVLYVLIDYMEISDDIAKNHTPRTLVFAYYEALVAPILSVVLPFAFLVAALVATAGLVRSSETTALLSSGISLFRSVASLLVLSVLTGALLFVFGERIVPRATSESERLRDIILKHPPVVLAGTDVWFRGTDGRFFSAGTFDPTSGSARDVSVLELDPATFRLTRRSFARRGNLVPGRGLKMQDGWVRSFGPSGDELFLSHPQTFEVPAPEAAKVFAVGRTDPRQMSSRELIRFIEARRRAGADVAVLATGLYAKSANAFSALLLTLLGLPYAFRFGKRGAVAGVGVALLLGLSYLFVSSLFLRVGEAGSLPPLLAAWAPNILFGLGAAYGLLGVRT